MIVRSRLHYLTCTDSCGIARGMLNLDAGLVYQIRRYVGRIATDLHRRLPKGGTLTRDDLIGAGWTGFLQAARIWDPTRGTALLAYCGPSIRWAMCAALRRQMREPQTVPIDPLADEVATSAEASPERVAERASQREYVRRAIASLPSNQRQVVLARYYGEQRLAKIGQTTRCSRQRVHQIHNRALRRLRGKLKRVHSEA